MFIYQYCKLRNAVIALIALISFGVSAGRAMDQVSLRRDGQLLKVEGKVLIESVDGGLLLEDRSGVLWAVKSEELVERKENDAPYRRWNEAEQVQQLAKEFPGFRTHTTVHYLIAYNTSPEYARWCGSLFERLYAAFSNFWKRRDFDWKEPSGPLIAFVFDSKQSFARYAHPELGDATPAIAGYYSLKSNRITMYDLTGVEAFQIGGRASSAEHINRILSQPQAERTVATIIHEATHQLVFNCGLQQRYADIPLWVSEGIAVFFETPDLQSKSGWRTIGEVNRVRLADFHAFAPRRRSDSLRTLIASDERFRRTDIAPHAYAEAWALNYYLLRKRQADYVKYLKILAEKRPLIPNDPEERLRDFQSVFGEDLARFDTEFIRYIRTVR